MKNHIYTMTKLSLSAILFTAIHARDLDNFDLLKKKLDDGIALVGKDSEKKDIKEQLAVLITAKDAQSPLPAVRRDAFKALLSAFSDTCVPAGSAKERLKTRLRALETSLSVYAGFLSRLIQKIKQVNLSPAILGNKLVLIEHELQEVLYWKEFIHEAI